MDTLDAFSVYLEAGVHQAAAEALSLQNREADAVAEYSKAIELDPDYPEAYSFRARAYYELMQEDIALTKEVAQRTVSRAIARGDNTDVFPSYVDGLSAYLYQLESGAFKERAPDMSTEQLVFEYYYGCAFFIER